MYPEFIAIYVMLSIIITLLIVAILFLFKLLKKRDNDFGPQIDNMPSYYQQPYQNMYSQQPMNGNIVLCKRCATQFDSSNAYCPQCGARR